MSDRTYRWDVMFAHASAKQVWKRAWENVRRHRRGLPLKPADPATIGFPSIIEREIA